MHKRALAVLFFATFFVAGLLATQAKPPVEQPQATTQEAVVADQSVETAASDLEFGGELLASLKASNFVYCKNIGGACTSNSQCGNLGTCTNNVCECECNYGAYCNAYTNCGYAGFCNEFTNHCACY